MRTALTTHQLRPGLSDVDAASDLRSLIAYDETTGVMHWRSTGKGRRLDLSAGSTDRYGYLQIRIRGRAYFVHRLAWLYTHDKWPAGVIDHINGNVRDNRLANLRDVSRRTNQENQRRAAASNKTTAMLGASLHKASGKYAAAIQVGGKTRYLGLYATPELAHSAYVAAKRELHKGATI